MLQLFQEAENNTSSVVSALNIYERKEGGAVELWKHVYPHGDLPGKLLPADECIVYDRIAFPDAPLLASGRPYNAVMTAAAERDRKLSRRWYGGNFCMIDAAGKRVPHQILWDKRESGGLGISVACRPVSHRRDGRLHAGSSVL